jgi:hypothetical protein
MDTDRAKELLNAALLMLQQADEGPYVQDVLSMTIHYDDADCDGRCLMDDIENFLEYGV